jgi:hypothetical protein
MSHIHLLTVLAIIYKLLVIAILEIFSGGHTYNLCADVAVTAWHID